MKVHGVISIAVSKYKCNSPSLDTCNKGIFPIAFSIGKSCWNTYCITCISVHVQSEVKWLVVAEGIITTIKHWDCKIYIEFYCLVCYNYIVAIVTLPVPCTSKSNETSTNLVHAEVLGRLGILVTHFQQLITEPLHILKLLVQKFYYYTKKFGY